ncbi:hypothetical protein C790_03767 [Morganella morganii SC01]|nr:hypothetical protein C790_03767 [Morganella morganii SC01]
MEEACSPGNEAHINGVPRLCQREKGNFILFAQQVTRVSEKQA